MADLIDLLAECLGFDWDENNSEKNWIAHQVRWIEAEEIFFNEPLIVAVDLPHSTQEARFFALGQTDASRLLFLAFTIRQHMIRVISARDMSRRERKVYQDAQNKGALEQAKDEDAEV
jgi:uncharacterized DUF497 family protein